MSKDKKVLKDEAAFEAVRERVEALAVEDVVISGTSYEDAGSRTLALAKAIAETPGVLAALLSLPAAVWSRKNLDELEVFAEALLYCHRQSLTASATTADVLVPAAVVATAGELVARMDKLLDYYLGDNVSVAKELTDIRGGSGYLDTAQDLTRYAALVVENEDDLSHDKKYYRKTDVEDARKYATQIRTYYHTPNQKPWPDRTRRVFTLLEEAVDEVRVAGQFVFRNDPATLALFISLRPGRAGGRRRRNNDAASAPVAPVAPAAPAAPAATDKPDDTKPKG